MVTSALKLLCALGVFCFIVWQPVLAAIDFEHQPRCMTSEINNILADRRLFPEMEPLSF